MKIANHANNPANQPFNIKGKKNSSKKRAWWQLGKENKSAWNKKAED